VLWHSWPWSRIAAIVVLALLIPVSMRFPALVVSAMAVAVVALVVIRDRSHKPVGEAVLEARLAGRIS
jgi:hypothetical protein